MFNYFKYKMEELKEKTSLNFNVVYNDGDSIVLETEKVFHHEEDGLNFKYRYAIEAVNYYEITGEIEYKGQFYVTIYLIVEKQSLHSEKAKSLTDSHCIEFGDIVTSDLIAEGYSISFAEDVVEENNLDECILFSKHLIPHLDSMRGFYLDKPFNALGTNGWRLLHDFVNNKSWL